MRKCRDCNKPIRFINGKNGRSIACDNDLVYIRESFGGPVTAVISDGTICRGFAVEKHKATVIGYRAHSETCRPAPETRGLDGETNASRSETNSPEPETESHRREAPVQKGLWGPEGKNT